MAICVKQTHYPLKHLLLILLNSNETSISRVAEPAFDTDPRVACVNIIDYICMAWPIFFLNIH